MTKEHMPMAVAIELESKPYIPFQDKQGNVRRIVDVMTCKVVSAHDFSAFGEVLESKGEIFNPWQYAAKRFDPDINLIDFGNRFYSPVLGRWITTDPAGFINGMNLYSFLRSNPFKYVDPDGRAIPFILIPVFAGGFALGGGVTLAFVSTEIVLGSITVGLLGWGAYTLASNINDATAKDALGALGSLINNANEPPDDEEDESFAKKIREGAQGAYTVYNVAKKLSDNSKKSSRNRFKPDETATKEHTVFRRNSDTGEITHYETYEPQTNPKNPNPWETVKRYDGNAEHPHKHFNKHQQEWIETPHVHDSSSPGGVRYPEKWEIPNG
jgi:RHS repeat-associated protein